MRFAAVRRQRVSCLHVFEEYGALRGAHERRPVRRLPRFVVHLEYSKRAFMNGSHGNALPTKS